MNNSGFARSATGNTAALRQLAGTHAQPLPHALRALGAAFGTAVPTAGLPSPHWVAASEAMARELGLEVDWQGEAGSSAAPSPMLNVLSGNLQAPASVKQGGAPAPLTWSSVYSGHQFGQWAGQLGDGRAHSLGCLQGRDGQWQELQLKGSGLTPYSRMGDGRAVLRSSIREFLASEAMAALGVPTTRALAIVGSPLPVAREEMETAAVVTRVAPSFIRFGHFEHFAAQRDTQHLRQLVEFVVDQYLPECRDQASAFAGNLAAALLAQATQRTARLFAQFQALGFCHGVLNTDNMSILGLAIDYGPFQFMDGFNPGHICNHSDHAGRYSYKNQPSVAYWNLFCLGQALMPLIADEQLALRALEPFQQAFSGALAQQMAAKMGLHSPRDGDGELTQALLQILAAARADWPLFWRRLSHEVARDFALPRSEPLATPPTQKSLLAESADLFADAGHRTAMGEWLTRYRSRLAQGAEQNGAQDNARNNAKTAQAMLAVNPEYVLRNHLCEQAIALAKTGDFSGVTRLLALVQSPFTHVPGAEDASDMAPAWASNICISCSS